MDLYKPYKSSKLKITRPKRKFFVILGTSLIIVSVLILGLCLWDIAGGLKGQFFSFDLPGFQMLDLKNTGLYAGVYQHRGPGPIPAEELIKMQVRIFSEGSYEEVPVMMNTTGQTFQQLGVKGMPLFNFIVQKPGRYTLSGVYPDGVNGRTVPVLLMAQSAQNIKGTLIAGFIFFVLFLGVGIWVLVKAKTWAATPA